MATDPITEAEFKEALPAQVRKNVNPDVLDYINNGIADPEVLAVYRENVIGLASVMNEGKFKVYDYLNAVRYVSHKLLGDSQVQAWAKTFRDRYNVMKKAGKTTSEVAAVASRYNASKLVCLLMGQTLMPTHILNAPMYQRSLNKLANLMDHAASEKVQCDAASKLVDTLKPPEVKKVELDVAMKEDDSIKELREATLALARGQNEAIRKGQASPKMIAESTIIEAEVVTDDN